MSINVKMFYKILGVFDLNIILKNIVIFIANLLVIAQITKLFPLSMFS
jgi:hypothetical protein